MKKMTTPLMIATLLFSASSVAGMNSIAQCNDCSPSMALGAATEFGSDSVYVVDFVNRTAKKYVANSKGNKVIAKMSIGEITHLNRKFDYRKTYLHAVNQ
ncbi:hypothetical protein [Shewanella sp. 10N.286.48.A6]|uniref:hypothetical protein n=1 Tax=Shewanella sp. 10N.286.48.A6 TaxID=1880833 RepID=UPI000C835EAF|nr:hypothetical protein [Shewanella sp. 10N.286.48.A6]PMI02548.1 hypothetical protein BCU55_06635 [Shewanella sp. 10N.286.48.A6]